MAKKKPLALYSGVQKEIPTSDTTEVGSLFVNNYIYLRGDDSTDGSVRFSSPSSGLFTIEVRDGTWGIVFTVTK